MLKSEKKALDIINQATQQIKESDRISLMLAISSTLSGLSLVSSFILIFCFSQFNNKPIAPFVQLNNGETIAIDTLQGNDRSPETIKSFVAISMDKLFSWQARMPPKNTDDLGKVNIDSGVQVTYKNQKKKVPTSVVEAGYALAEDFRKEMLVGIGDMVSQTDIFTARGQTKLVIDSIERPIRIKDGVWDVDLVSRINYQSRNNPTGGSIPFNRRIRVKAVPAPLITEAQKKQDSSGLGTTIAKARAAGLEIVSITSLTNQIKENDQ